MATIRRTSNPARLLLMLALAFGFVMFAPTATYAATRNVCPSGCAYSTIQAAINAASNGDTINIAAGTYDGGLIIRSSSGVCLPAGQRGYARLG